MKPISPQLLQKLKESLQTAGNNANPRINVVVSRAKDTVRDADYWIVETIREMEGLGDVSVAPRRFKSYGRPNRLYGIHVHNGEVKTLIREYPDKLKQGWVNQFSLGNGVSVATAFNGYWERYRKLWRLITEEKPYISWVDNNNDLWVQYWDDGDSKFQLSSSVSKVRMIRAWKNTAIHYLDQGVVVAYIKTDGTVWYRNYCIQENYEYAWEFEKQLTDFSGVAVNVNLFITNDYRMGFIIEDNLGQIHWLVTHRNWGGMASPAESLITGISDISFSVAPISFMDWDGGIEKIDTSIEDIWFNVAEPIYPELLSISNDDEYTIRLQFNHEIDYDLKTVKTAFSVKDSMNVNFNILSTAPGIDNSELILTLVNFNAASGNMFVTYNRNVIELDSVNQGSRFILEGFIAEFTPELIPPEGFGEENLTFSIADITFDVKRAYYTNMYEEENIETSITDISFVVTQVGSNPL
jgi:hypothetical protein